MKAAVIGCIDGNETAGIAVVRALERGRADPGVDLWLIEDMNPDGVAAGTLQNADRVDLSESSTSPAGIPRPSAAMRRFWAACNPSGALPRQRHRLGPSPRPRPHGLPRRPSRPAH